MKIVFFGSSDFSIPSLEACMTDGNEVSLVISTPDQKKGRGLKKGPTPVSLFAKEHSLALECPEKLKSEELIAKVEALEADLFVVASYGKFIPSRWLEIPKILPINVHPSLLPKYRGAAPINWPILNGDAKTGVSIMRVTKELDAGDVYEQLDYDLNLEIDAEKLSHELAQLSVKALSSVLKRIQTEGVIEGVAQVDSESCYARKLEKEDGQIDWNRSAQQIANQVRGLKPWPLAYSYYEDERFQILETKVDETQSAKKIGEIVSIDKKGVFVSTGKGVLEVQTVRPAGKNAMSAADFARGRRFEVGANFGNPTT